jgi:hypothetical protein
VVDAVTGEAPWGVEWLPARADGGTVINAVNLLNHSVNVKILRGRQPFAAADLLSLGGREKVETLQPMTPALAAPENN